MNHYDRLEVARTASQEVIRAAYKSLMQRYHPDRNKDDPVKEEYAMAIRQAYEILSDPNRRAAYDLELQRSPALPPGRTAQRLNIPSAKAAPRNIDQPAPPYFRALLVMVFALSCLLVWISFSKTSASLPKNTQAQLSNALAPAQPMVAENVAANQEVFHGNSPVGASDSPVNKREVAVRTIPIYLKDMTVALTNPDNPPAQTNSVHVLSIPRLGVVVGAFDADSYIDYISKNKDMIRGALTRRLANAKFEELAEPEVGRAYLEGFILDAMDEITGSDRLKEYPSSDPQTPAHYGAVEIVLPENFSVK